ncbi:MAG TPA: two-component regulator propeller domain-containing protein [Blastocatellia bacterium]|nr:two-component regulator propeller domain-containing protein [Blastocatellia bacterium]
MLVRELSRPAIAFRLALLLMLLLGMSGRAQAERLPIKTYATTDGLAGDSVNRIVRDSRGFLWFCTSEGLSRFDGYKFTNYGVDQGLPDRQVNDFLETRSGVYWVATPTGLCRFNPGASTQASHPDAARHEPRFVVYHLGDDDRSDSEAPSYEKSRAVYKLCEDREGALWCGTESSLYRGNLENGQWVFTSVELGPTTSVGRVNAFSIIADQRGAIWILTGSGLYRRRSDGIVERYTALEGLSPTDSSSLFEDRDGNIWLGTNVGLCRLVPEPAPGRSVVARVYTKKDGLASNGISCMFQSSDGRLWGGTWSALNELLPTADKGGRQFRSYTSANGIIDVISLGEDRDGNLWIGTATNGAMKIAANGFTTYAEADGLRGMRVGQISEDRAGELCVFGGGNGKGFISRFDGGTFAAVELALPKGITQASWGWYQNMFEDITGEWWMSTFQGLVRYPRLARLSQLTHARPKAVYTTRDGLGGNELFRIFEDSHGDVWAGTLNGRSPHPLSRWERNTGTFRRYSKEDGIPPVAPTAFCEDTSGNLWIGFYNGGVARYREGRFALFSKDDGLPEGFIRALYLDHAARLWIATSEGGVARVDDPRADRPRFIAYTTADGLSSNHATCLTEDDWGRVYIGTGRGLDQLDPATGHIKHYTTADGLANNNLSVSFRDRGGALWFGTLDGLSRFIPEPRRTELPPSILVGGLSVAGVQQTISELGETDVSGLTLGANQNHLQIDFFGLSFGPGEALRYQYKLEGPDVDWSPLTDQRSVNFPNLSPGAYRFLVRAVSTEGLASQSPAIVAFTILPPMWQRWWFIALAATLIGLLAYSLFRYRVTRLIELERVRTRIATDLHDDIGSSLSQVSVLSEVVRRRVGSEPSVSEPLSMIADLSRDLVDSMNDIVWAINPRRDHLSDLTHRIRRFASDVFTARDIEFNFSAPEAQHDIRLGADMRREVFLIFKESVNNMVRHSGCTEANIEFLIESGWLELKIRDNGKGFEPDRESDGNGLVSMSQRTARIGGTLDISSNNGKGTMVLLRAPVGRHAWRKRVERPPGATT